MIVVFCMLPFRHVILIAGMNMNWTEGDGAGRLGYFKFIASNMMQDSMAIPAVLMYDNSAIVTCSCYLMNDNTPF